MPESSIWPAAPDLTGGGGNALQSAGQTLQLMSGLNALKHAQTMNPLQEEQARQTLSQSRAMNPLQLEHQRKANEAQVLEVERAKLLLQKQQQEFESQKALAGALKSSVDPQTGQIDWNKAVTTVASNPTTAGLAPQLLTTLVDKRVKDAQGIEIELKNEQAKQSWVASSAAGLLNTSKSRPLEEKDFIEAFSSPEAQKFLGGAKNTTQVLLSVPRGPDGKIDPNGAKEWLISHALQGQSAKESLDYVLPKFQERTAGGVTYTEGQDRLRGTSSVVPGSVVPNAPTAEQYDQGIRMPSDVSKLYSEPSGNFGGTITGAQAQNVDAQGKPVGAPVGVGPSAVSQKALRTEQGKLEAAAVEKLPDAITGARNSLRLIKELEAHKGLDTAIGLSGQVNPKNYIWGTDAKNAQARIEQIQGQTFLKAYDTLRGTGQITEVEGEKATAAIGRLQRSQSPEEFRAALKDLREVTETALKRAEEKAKQYGLMSDSSSVKLPSGVKRMWVE